MQVIDVSYRDGKYFVVDGQHRVAALKIIGEKSAMCKVHQGLTYEEEAVLFIRLNKDRKGQTALSIFNSLFEAKDAMATAIKQIVELSGFYLPSSDTHKRGNMIVAVSSLQHIYRNIGADGLQRELELIKKTWPSISEAVDRRILLGLYAFIKQYGKDFKDGDFIKTFSKITPQTIIAEGRAMPSFVGTFSYTPFGMIFLKYYNKGRHNQLPNKF
jgi:hypothetical protein